MRPGADRWIGWTTTGCVGLLALVARSGRKGGAFPWALLVAGSVASLAANVAVAEPTLVGRVIAAWPSFALTASYELLTRQVRRSATGAQAGGKLPHSTAASPRRQQDGSGPVAALTLVDTGPRAGRHGRRVSGQDLQQQAWQWAMAHRGADGSLPSGKQIASYFGRHERWGRLVKRAGIAGQFSVGDVPGGRSGDGEEVPAAAAT